MKQGTLINLVYPAYNVCSTEYLWRKELLLLEKKIICKNNYSHWVIKQILTQVEKQQERNNINNNNNNNDSNTNDENSFRNVNNSNSLHYHTKGNKVKKFLNPSRQLYIDLYQIT